MRIWHLTFAAEGRQTLYTRERDLLGGVRTLVRVRGELLLFCIVDDHIHVVLDTTRPGIVAGALSRALAVTTTARISPAHRTIVESRAHLMRLVRYLLGQPAKHRLAPPAALWPGSCILDLVGARRLPGLSLGLGRYLPRWRCHEAFEAVDLPAEPLRAPGGAEIRALGTPRVVAAAAAAAGIADLQGLDAVSIRARQAAASVTASAELSSRQLAEALGVHVNSARRLMRATADPVLLDATRARLALELRVERTLPPAPHPRTQIASTR